MTHSGIHTSSTSRDQRLVCVDGGDVGANNLGTGSGRNILAAAIITSMSHLLPHIISCGLSTGSLSSGHTGASDKSLDPGVGFGSGIWDVAVTRPEAQAMLAEQVSSYREILLQLQAAIKYLRTEQE